MSKDKYFPDHYFLSIFFCPEVFIYKQYHSKSLFMPSVCGSNICLVLNTFTFKFKIISHAHWVWQITALIQGLITNIARGTTDPGYWVHNLNDLFQPKCFQIDLSQKHDSSYRLNTLGPLCLWQCFFDNPSSKGQRRFASLPVGPQWLVQRHWSCHQPGCSWSWFRGGHKVWRCPSAHHRPLLCWALRPTPSHYHAIP